MGIGGAQDLEHRIADLAADRTYKFVDRFGLPTFFALLMFVLAAYMAYAFNKQSVELIRQNQVKIDMLTTIAKNQDTIISSTSHALDLTTSMLQNLHALNLETKELDERELEILKRLDVDGYRNGKIQR